MPAEVGARSNWSGTVTYGARELLRPRNLDDVRRAVTSRRQVTVLGSGHSFSRIADTDATQITLADMVPHFDIDTDRLTARVSAGMTYAAVNAQLDRHGLALPNLASLPHISVGGAVATGTHGSGVLNPSLAASIVGLECVRANGDVDVLTRDHPDLDAHRVGLGALGVMTSVDLAVEPRYDVRQQVHLNLAWDAAEEHFESIMSAGYSVSMFTAFQADGVRQVWTKRREDRSEPVVDLAGLGAMPADSPMHPVTGQDPSGVTMQGAVAGPWHERLPHFRSSFAPSSGAEIQCEYLAPAEHAVPAIQALRRIGWALNPSLLVAEIRRVAPDTAWLAPSSGRESVAFHFTLQPESRAVEAVLPHIDQALAPFDARPHWAKVTAATPEQIRGRYPMLASFAAVAARVDPAGRFMNRYLEAVLRGAHR